MPRQGKTFILFEGQGEDGVAEPINVSPFDSLVIEVSTSMNANGDLKFLGAAGTRPDFTSAPNINNVFSPIRLLDLDTGAGLNGSTGIELSGTDIVKQYKVNVDHLSWITASLTNWAAGFFRVRVYGMANERLR